MMPVISSLIAWFPNKPVGTSLNLQYFNIPPFSVNFYYKIYCTSSNDRTYGVKTPPVVIVQVVVPDVPTVTGVAVCVYAPDPNVQPYV